MPTIIRERRQQPRNYHSDWYEDVLLREMEQECCGICLDYWPSSMMLDEDGRRRCPDCSANGLTETEKAEIRAHDTARITERQTRPQPPSYREPASAGTITRMTSSGTRVTQTDPLYLTQGGASKTIVCTGIGFASTDTVSASSGITVSKSVDSSTQVTLTVSADSGTAAGDWYHITYNGTVHRAILRVR